jgi:hypothetical protein
VFWSRSALENCRKNGQSTGQTCCQTSFNLSPSRISQHENRGCFDKGQVAEEPHLLPERPPTRPFDPPPVSGCGWQFRKTLQAFETSDLLTGPFDFSLSFIGIYPWSLRVSN